MCLDAVKWLNYLFLSSTCKEVKCSTREQIPSNLILNYFQRLFVVRQLFFLSDRKHCTVLRILESWSMKYLFLSNFRRCVVPDICMRPSNVCSFGRNLLTLKTDQSMNRVTFNN